MMMLLRPVLPVFALAALAGCASLPESSDTASVAAVAAAAATNAVAPKTSGPGERAHGTPAAAAAAAAAAAVAAQGPQHRAFADIVRDAKELPGLFHIYQKDDRVWLEIGPDQFEKPFFFSVNLSSGLGEKFFFAGLMGESYVASFHKLSNNQVQLIARNT